jgi:quercetin dioxygenase-like cupin family protein
MSTAYNERTEIMQAMAPDQAERVEFQGFGTRYLLRSEATGGRFALVEHDLAPRTLGSPLHTHANEDEYSFVTAGRLGVQVGDDVHVAGAGELVVKPRGTAHAFWNPGDEPVRFLELISPGGFEQYFSDLAPFLPPHRPEPDFAGLGATAARYGLEMQPESIGPLVERHGLRMG